MRVRFPTCGETLGAGRRRDTCVVSAGGWTSSPERLRDRRWWRRAACPGGAYTRWTRAGSLSILSRTHVPCAACWYSATKGRHTWAWTFRRVGLRYSSEVYVGGFSGTVACRARLSAMRSGLTSGMLRTFSAGGGLQVEMSRLAPKHQHAFTDAPITGAQIIGGPITDELADAFPYAPSKNASV